MFEFICGFATRLKEAVYRLFGVELNQDRLDAKKAGVEFFEWMSAKQKLKTFKEDTSPELFSELFPCTDIPKEDVEFVEILTMVFINKTSMAAIAAAHKAAVAIYEVLKWAK